MSIATPGTPLLGPADADNYRAKVGRYGDRFYVDPLPADDIAVDTDAAWPSVSTVKKAASSDWTFVALARAAEAIHSAPRGFDGLDQADIYEQLKTINRSGLRKAGARGTNVHTMLERGLRGRPLTDPMDGSAGREYEPAVRAFLGTYRPRLVAAELVCIDRDLHGVGYGGTCDAIIHIDGRMYIVDWKSRSIDSAHGAYPEEAAQLGAYASAQYYIAAGPRRIPIPADIAGGLIISIRPDGYRIYPVDLQRATTHWRAMHSWWVARRTERESLGKPWAPRAAPAVEDAITAAPDVDTLTAIWAANRTVWTDQMTTLAAARKSALLTTNGRKAVPA